MDATIIAAPSSTKNSQGELSSLRAAPQKRGKPGFGPYPTHYDEVVSRKGILEFCAARGFSVAEERGSCTYALEKRLGARLSRAMAITLSTLTLGTLTWRHNNLTYVLKKEAST